MKIQQKVIVYPLLIMVVTFVISLIGVEYQFKRTWEEQVDKELKMLTSSALTSISYLNEQFMPDEENRILHQVSKDHTQNNNIRLSIINHDGELVGDSALTPTELMNAQNYLKEKEINVARLTGSARVIRQSDLFNQSTVYLAQYDSNTGYTARASMPVSTYQFAILKMRSGFISIAIIAMMIMTAFGVFINRIIQQAIKKEQNLQDIRVEDRTREITLLQTMTTMLNAAKNFDETGQVILSIMPRLLPDLSGKLYLLDEQEKLKELVSWGPELGDNVSVLRSSRNANNGLQSTDENANQVARCQTSSHLICVDLIDEQELFGVIHFLGSKKTVRDKNIRNVVMQLSEQISLGLTNLRVKKQLHYQAIRDPLTNLYNRRFMLEGFEQALNRAERHGLNLSVLMIDLDHFKSFNDTFGHKAGDTVLIAVAELFKSNLRLEDIACRFGGEEFCIICPDTALKDAFALAEKLRTSVSQLELVEQEQSLGKITISTGISVYPNHALTTQQLIIQADQALYGAKNRGRNTTVVASNNQFERKQ